MRHKKRKFSIFIVVIIVGLVGFRLYLPHWVLDYVNERIERLDGYSGSVKDIDLHLWRGAYAIDSLEIFKTDSGTKEPFVAASRIDLSIEWHALIFDQALVVESDIYNADLTFTKTQTGEGAGWISFIDSLSPFDINRVDIHSGRIAYKDFNASPVIDIYAENIDAHVTNIRNTEDREIALPSDIVFTGNSVGEGALELNGKMNVIRELPNFDLDFSLKDADLTAFNDYTNEFLAIDFQGGNIGLFAELAAADGTINGYVKPVATDIELVDVPEQDGNPLNIIWESVASVFIELFKNQSQDQFAMRVPIEGSFKEPERDMWSAFLSIFQNAFSQAFSYSNDGAIEFNDAYVLEEQEEE